MVRALGEQLQHGHQSGTQLHVAFIDLDGFKEINDEYGHDAGDRFLIHIANRLVSHCRSTDTIARYGGDEFVLLRFAVNANHKQQRNQLSKELERITQGSYEVCGETIHYTGASVGIITTEPSQLDIAEVLQLSDTAMYQQKRARKGR